MFEHDKKLLLTPCKRYHDVDQHAGEARRELVLGLVTLPVQRQRPAYPPLSEDQVRTSTLNRVAGSVPHLRLRGLNAISTRRQPYDTPGCEHTANSGNQS